LKWLTVADFQINLTFLAFLKEAKDFHLDYLELKKARIDKFLAKDSN